MNILAKANRLKQDPVTKRQAGKTTRYLVLDVGEYQVPGGTMSWLLYSYSHKKDTVWIAEKYRMKKGTNCVRRKACH